MFGNDLAWLSRGKPQQTASPGYKDTAVTSAITTVTPNILSNTDKDIIDTSPQLRNHDESPLNTMCSSYGDGIESPSLSSSQTQTLLSQIQFYKTRLRSLEDHYEVALEESNHIDRSIKHYEQCKLKDVSDAAKSDLEGVLQSESDKIDCRIKFLEELLPKRIEENNLINKHLQDTRLIQHRRTNESNFPDLDDTLHKARSLRTKMEQLLQMFVPALVDRNETIEIISKTRVFFDQSLKQWKEIVKTIELQQSMIDKLRSETRNLNLVIRQLTDATTSHMITDNVKEKCKTIMAKKDQSEADLKRQESRLLKMIQKLQHKQTMIAKENDLLTVEKERTQDLMQYYDNRIESNQSC